MSLESEVLSFEADFEVEFDSSDSILQTQGTRLTFLLESSTQRRHTIRMQTALADFPGFDEKLLRMAPQMDRFEGYADAHSQRIASFADSLGVAFNLASRDRFFLQQAALVHDIGELKMNRDYIKSTSVLSPDERLDLQRHPVIGEQETAKLGLPRGVQLLVRWHHEWWNGGGYPDGLISEQIPLAARILRVADTYAALTSPRPFRAGWSVEEAKKYLVEWAGIEFDPAIVKAFLAVREPVLARSEAYS